MKEIEHDDTRQALHKNWHVKKHMALASCLALFQLGIIEQWHGEHKTFQLDDVPGISPLEPALKGECVPRSECLLPVQTAPRPVALAVARLNLACFSHVPSRL